MSKRASEYQVVGTSALKQDVSGRHSARIIAFPSADVRAQSLEPSRRAKVDVLRERALSGLTREELRGVPLGRMTKAQSWAFALGGLLLGLAVVTLF